jgi:hypothetical protein
MAAPINDGKTKQHRSRKNPRSAELWRERKKALNAARPKQIWIESQLFVDGEFVRDAHWSREAA